MRSRRLKVGIYTYPVHFVLGKIANDDGDECLCGSAAHQIKNRGIKVSLDESGDAGETLLHEVLHAVFYERDLNTFFEDESDMEHAVTQLAVGLTALFRDNRWLHEVVVNGVE